MARGRISTSGGTSAGRRAPALTSSIIRDLHDLPGATTQAVRALRRSYCKALAHDSPATVVAVAKALFDNGSWSARLIACELIVARPDALARLTETIVVRWARGLSDWGSVDMYGVTVAGLAWRERRLSDERVMSWTRSSDRWRRRLALVATVPLNSRARGGSGDTGRTLSVCRALVVDRDDMVVKALSWALRELVKRDPESVKRFIADEDRRLAPRVRREVRTKLETGRKIRTGATGIAIQRKVMT